MREIKFELGEITDDVIIYVDKYIKLLMSNVKYSFLEKFNAEQKLICNYIQIKENDIRFNKVNEAISAILDDDGTVADLEAAKSKMPEASYKRAKHVIEENARVLKVRELLESDDIAGVGKQLNLSHESSRTLFENSCEELDFLVDTVTPMNGIFGARLSGGGFGGAVVALADSSFSQNDAEKVADIYEARFGKRPMIFTCASGDGAKVIKHI